MNTAPSPHGMLVGDHRPDEGVLDEVYERFARSHPFLPITHFIDHVTMGSEALVGLGLGARARSWSARHHVRPYVLPSTGIPIASTWRQALGREECHGDWLRHFEIELEADPFPAALARYVLALVAVVVGVDVLFRNRFWERLMMNVGIVLVFAATYLRFLKRP